jgi:hypothetical protein
MLCGLAALILLLPLFPWQDMQLRVDRPRPLLAAIQILEERHGWLTNYEDPPYTNPADVVVLSPTFTGSRRRIVEPRSGRIEIEYPAVAGGGSPESHTPILQMLLKDHVRHDNAGAFIIRVVGGMNCIVPAVGSVLDVPVTLQPKERSFRGVVDDVVAAVSAATGVRFRAPVVAAPTHARFTFGASTEPASAVLIRLFKEAGGRYSWALLFFPESGFELNIRGRSG